ncbi:MAG: tRNA uridine-5-carboxymethylaminomethyl(34) synthesis GTPase MnmE [Myxococcota bacterium]|nr:tRNA uridine-5-carboxymethylaminomethyl(34) synthesis GTPase MnmE [Myxococcota bacterium]
MSRRACIVACATPWGRGGVALVRLSGPDAPKVAAALSRIPGGWPPPRRARLAHFQDAQGPVDTGLITHFPGPRSYTGEALVELSCHGNPLIVERLLAAAVSAGARMAEPGEFTRRAFENGRMDLTRAEAVLQAIEASSVEGLRVAQAGLTGRITALGEGLAEALVEILAELEARLDYPGEDLTLQEDRLLEQRLGELGAQAQAAADSYQAGRVLVEGATVALVGPVNAGKSSLFNALGGSTRALVSPTPGTTRDVVERRVRLGPVAVTLLDTAGLREDAGEIEAQGIALARALTAQAELLVVVVPAHQPELAQPVLAETRDRKRVVVGNHADRVGAVLEWEGQPLLPTAAHTGQGVEALGEAIAAALVGESPGSAGLVIASQRQRDLLLEVAEACREAAENLVEGAGPAVSAQALYGALERLDDLSGKDTRERVLDALFSRFCIGK